MKLKLSFIIFLLSLSSFAQVTVESAKKEQDTVKKEILKEVVITASRTKETFLRSPITIEQLKSSDVKTTVLHPVLMLWKN